jgi:hypothetical protein
MQLQYVPNDKMINDLGFEFTKFVDDSIAKDLKHHNLNLIKDKVTISKESIETIGF